MTPIKPVKNEQMPESPAIIIGIVSLRLLKNVSPPLSPNSTSIKNNPRNIKKDMINPIDHFPRSLFGVKMSAMYRTYFLEI